MTQLTERPRAETSVAETSRTELRDFVLDRLARAARDGSIAMVTVPAPTVPPETLLRLADRHLTEADRSHAMVWDPPSRSADHGSTAQHGSAEQTATGLQTIDDASVAGLGACAVLSCRGAERFASLRRAGSALLERVDAVGLDVPAIEPRLYGGLAFDVGASDEPAWSDFGDCSFTLPRYVYRCESRAARLALAVEARDAADDAARRAWADSFVGLLTALESVTPLAAPGHSRAAAGPTLVAVDDPSWIRRVDDIREAIGRGEVEKIVAARRSELSFDLGPGRRTVEPADVLHVLTGGLRASTRFAFRRGDACFLGATPERLVAKRGLEVVTEALAGSIESGGEHAAELLDSGKDRHEQQLVVDSIVRRLEPLCAELEVSPRRVRELREVLHLLTPIRGTLHSERHLLDLAEALHPTPAVGGVPTPAAMDWIREREQVGRGWYAAPVGWFDARGDGELWVGLRSCLLEPRRALLYAGAGIVADSDPIAELRETELKLGSMRSALLAAAEETVAAGREAVVATLERPVAATVMTPTVPPTGFEPRPELVVEASGGRPAGG